MCDEKTELYIFLVRLKTFTTLAMESFMRLAAFRSFFNQELKRKKKSFNSATRYPSGGTDILR